MKGRTCPSPFGSLFSSTAVSEGPEFSGTNVKVPKSQERKGQAEGSWVNRSLFMLPTINSSGRVCTTALTA